MIATVGAFDISLEQNLYIMYTAVRIDKQFCKPCNHIWYSRCNGLDLWCELVPLWDVSIGIGNVSYVENYVNVMQVLDQLVSGIEWTRLIITVFIWTITLRLKFVGARKFSVVWTMKKDKHVEIKMTQKDVWHVCSSQHSPPSLKVSIFWSYLSHVSEYNNSL
jgi:hypothetical protein